MSNRITSFSGVVAAFSVLTGAPVFAGLQSEPIFEALRVKPSISSVTDANGSVTIVEQRMVAGLACVKIAPKGAPPQYRCYYATETVERDPSAIFDALDPALCNVVQLRNGQRKEVGNLACWNAVNDAPPFNSWIDCEFQ